MKSKEQVTYGLFEHPFGKFLVVVNQGKVAFAGPAKGEAMPPHSVRNDSAVQHVFEEMSARIAGSEAKKSFPLLLEGTSFQLKVWKYLQAIPYGQVRSYAEVARAIGHPKASRAVGSACGKNPVSIFVPCHRVVTSAGGLGGFGWGIKYKKILLEREGSLPDA